MASSDLTYYGATYHYVYLDEVSSSNVVFWTPEPLVDEDLVMDDGL